MTSRIFPSAIPSLLGSILLMAAPASDAAVTDAVVSKSPPQLNQGRVKGSVRVMTGGNFNLNSELKIDGSLMVPGTPEIRVNGGATAPPILEGAGDLEPSNHRITLNGGALLGSITRRVDGELLPLATAPLAGSGNRHVHLNQPGDNPGDFSTIKTLTLNAQGGSLTLPPGRYERITINGAGTINLQGGTAAAPALYQIQQLDLNGGSRIAVAGPVELRLRNSLNANGYIGNPTRPDWLLMTVSVGSFTLNSQSAFHGRVVVPAGTLTVNGSSLLHGMAFSDRLTLNGDGIIECESSGGTPNLPPVASAGETSTARDTAVAIPLVAVDPENATLNYQIVTGPAHGSISLAGNIATYTPEPGYIGDDTFTFKVSDGVLESAPAPFVVHVFQPNRAPVAASPVFVLNQGENDAPLVLTASDPDDDALTWQIASQPSQGILAGTPPSLTYSHTGPRSTAVVEDTFTFTVTDSKGAVSAPGTVTLLLQPVNRAPSATAITAAGNEDAVIPITLTGTDPDGDPLFFEIVGDPADPLATPGPLHGTLFGDAPALTYHPAADFHGTDRFFFRVRDAALASPVAEVVLTVLPVNDAPVAVAQSVTGTEDEAVTILFDSTDIDGDALSYDVVLPAGFPGTVSVTGSSAVVTPDPDFHGAATFDFTATDASGAASTAEIALVIAPVNDPPVIVADPAPRVLAEDQSLVIAPAGTDPDGDTLSYEVTVAPLHGSLTANPDSGFTYTPVANYHGPDRFSFTVTDPSGLSSAAEVGIVIAPSNDPPVASGSRSSTGEGKSIEIPLQATDPDGDEVLLAITHPPAHGTVVIAAGKAIYVPEAGFSGIDRFRFTASDGVLTSEPAEVVVRVTANPRISILSPLTGALVPAGEPVVVQVSATDADGDLAVTELSVEGLRAGGGTSVVSQFSLGILAAGEHVLVATATDSAGGRTASAPVTITVEGTNTAPLVSAGADRVLSFGQLGANLLQNSGNEQPLVTGKIPAWTEVGGVAWGRGTPASRVYRSSFSTTNVYPAASEGSAYFHVPGDASGELFQDVTLDATQLAEVAGGTARIAFETRVRSYQPKDIVPLDFTGRPSAEYPIGALDEGGAVVEFFDAAGEMLDSQTATGTRTADRWVKFAASAGVPAATTRIRVRLLAEKNPILDAQPSVFTPLDPREKNDVIFDAVSLRFAAGADALLTGTVADDGLPAGGTTAITWSQVAGPAAVIAEPGQAVSPVALPLPGEYEFRMEAHDGLLSAADQVRIRVEAPAASFPPVVAAGSDIARVLSTGSIALPGSVTGGGTALSITWSQVSGPADASIADPLSAATTVKVPVPGRYVFTLSAFDGEWTEEDEIVLTVAAVPVRRPMDLVVVTDHSGSMWANKAEGDPSTPIYKARVAADQLLSRLDPATDRVSIRKFRSEVTPLTSDIALARASIPQARGEAGTTTGYAASNIDGGIQGALTHLLANPRTGAPDRVIVVFGDGAGPYPTDAAVAARNAGVRVIIVAFSNGIDPINTANQQAMASTPSDFISAATPEQILRMLDLLQTTLSLPLNSPPVVSAGPGMTLAEVSDTAYLRGSFQDDGLPEDTLPVITWEQVSGPAPVSFGSPESLDSQVSFTAAGDYRLRLTVSDGALSSSDTVSVRVAAPGGLPAPAGMTAWWPFDGNLRDVAGTRDLTRFAYWEQPQFTTGAVNQAFRFATGGDVLEGGTIGEIGLNDPAGFSIEFRFKPRSTNVGFLFALFNPATGFVDHGISWGEQNSGTFERQKLHFLRPPSGPTTTSASRITLTGSVVPLNAWHHVVMTHNRATNET